MHFYFFSFPILEPQNHDAFISVAFFLNFKNILYHTNVPFLHDNYKIRLLLYDVSIEDMYYVFTILLELLQKWFEAASWSNEVSAISFVLLNHTDM